MAQTENAEVTAQKLIAVYPILYLSRQYKVGEELPANDATMVELWLKNGTAAWVADEKAVSVKAKPVTAEPGVLGSAVSSDSEDGNNLVGKVPKTAARKKK